MADRDDVLVDELWPEIGALERRLDRLKNREEIKVKADKNSDDDEDADRIHRLLLRKQRATGSLGLNE